MGGFGPCVTYAPGNTAHSEQTPPSMFHSELTMRVLQLCVPKLSVCLQADNVGELKVAVTYILANCLHFLSIQLISYRINEQARRLFTEEICFLFRMMPTCLSPGRDALISMVFRARAPVSQPRVCRYMNAESLASAIIEAVSTKMGDGLTSYNARPDRVYRPNVVCDEE